MDQNSADEGGKLFIGLGVGELCSPAVVELHIARMGGVADDELRIAAGLFPFEALGLLGRGLRILAVIPFVLDIVFVRSGTDDFSGKRVMDVLFARNSDVVYTLFGGFLQSAGNTGNTIADSTMSHDSIVIY